MKAFKIKIIILTLMMGVMSAVAFAQTISVPQKVQTAFSIKYPQVQLKNWNRENGQYVASFVWDNRDCEATYANDGSWISTLIIYRNLFRHLTPVMRDELRNGAYSSSHFDQARNLQNPTLNIFLLAVGNDNGNMAGYDDIGSVDMVTLDFNHNGKMIKSVDHK